MEWIGERRRKGAGYVFDSYHVHERTFLDGVDDNISILTAEDRPSTYLDLGIGNLDEFLTGEDSSICEFVREYRTEKRLLVRIIISEHVLLPRNGFDPVTCDDS